MKPILYAANETAFTSKGLGTLYDAISCTVEEERNGKYELQMEYPVGGQHFEDIAHSRFIYAKPADNSDPQPFSIYAISKPINGMCTINAEHISYRLTNIPVTPPIESTSPADALQELKTKAAETCPFTFWTDKQSQGTFTVKEPKSIRSLLAGTEGSVLDSFGGGEYQWDKFAVKLYQQRGSDNGVTLKYGKNITDLKQEENIQNTLTGVMPYWYKVDEVDGEQEETLVLLSERVVHSSNSANFPYYRTAILDCSSQFKEQPTQAQLRSFAQNYVNTSGFGVPEVSITVQFLPLWQSEEYAGLANLEHVNLCDTVTVEFEPLGVSATAKVIRTKYNVLTERYDEIELGDAKRSLSTSIRSDIDAAKADLQKDAQRRASEAQGAINAMASTLRQEMTEAIEQIKTGSDGAIEFTYDTNGKRTQILAMDKSTVEEAKKILLINYEGIGGFSNGYNTTKSGYTLAITRDGKINASAIAAGTITAALIMGNTFRIGGSTSGDGTIRVQDASGNNICLINKNGFTLYDSDNAVNVKMDRTGFTCDGTWILRRERGNVNYNDLGVPTAFTGDYQTTQRVYCRYDKESLAWDAKSYINYLRSMGNYEDGGKQSDSIVLFRIYSYDTSDNSNGAKRKGLFGVFPGSRGATAYVENQNNVPAFMICKRSNSGSFGGMEWKKLYNSQVLSEFFSSLKSITTAPGFSNVDYFRPRPDAHMIYSSSMFRVGKFWPWYTGSPYEMDEDGSPPGSYVDDPRDPSTVTDFHLYATQNAFYHSGKKLAHESSSSRRYKHDIKPLQDEALDPHKLLDLPIRQAVYNEGRALQYNDMAGKTLPVFIAEEVDEIYPSATIHDPDTGLIENWDERRIIPGMLALIQEQAKKIEELETRIAVLEGRQ